MIPSAPHPAAGAARPGDVPLTERDFLAIAALAKSEYGLHLEPAKKSMIRSRLTRRVRALGLDSFAAYCALVSAGDPAERDHFVTALTTNVTSFYRETHHFQTLESEILPGLRDRARRGERIRLWSAGCSTGQEPYSLAGSVLRVFPEAARHDVRILATDLDPEALRKAEAGVYAAEDRQCPAGDWRDRVFGRGVAAGDHAEVRADLRPLVVFRRLNLNGPWPITGRFDAILCRNVAIYFDRETQDRLWSRLAEALHPGGHLFIGHSERIAGPPAAEFDSTGITTYRRRARPDAPGPQTRKEH